ncbi:MAG: hypothetical protein MI741_22000, partial [Rhodospirillales bacterium]|nr:hypothetical protein [Rhodospirillales bacterium]
MIRLAIHGAAGRMGRRLIALACQADDLQVTAALDHNENPQLGQDAGRLAGIDVIDVPLASSLSEPVDVIIDFSLPQGLAGVLDQCRSSGASLVSGTTGL